MAQLSGFWTTGGSTGHQQTSYTQSHLATAGRIFAACSVYEGVAAGFMNQLAGSVPSANMARIATGGGMVDGHWYLNDASYDVTIPSAIGAGNTRIDRIVLRCSWADYKAEITRIAGVDAASPTPPDITQNSGSTYDIKLYQVLVDTSGNVVLTDERDWAIGAVDGSTLTVAGGQIKVANLGIDTEQLATHSVETGKIADDAVTNAKLADPYDVAIVKILDSATTLTVKDGLLTLPVPDVWDGKTIVKLWARLTGAASVSGDVVIRIYNETDSVVVGTVTIAQGNRIGYSTSITNPIVGVDEILRIDVTSAGSEAAGLDVQIKVDKS